MKKRVARRARLDLAYFGAAPAERDIECEVRIEGKGINIAVPCMAMWIHGLRVGPGHFMVMGTDGRIGSLHRFPTGQTFAGLWQRRGEQGFWRIYLSCSAMTRMTRGVALSIPDAGAAGGESAEEMLRTMRTTAGTKWN